MDNLKRDFKSTLDKMFENNLADFSAPQKDKQKVLIALTNGKKRASTFVGVGNTIRTAFEAAKAKAVKSVLGENAAPRWVYMAFVSDEESMPLKDFYEDIGRTKKHYYRKGWALDNLYQFAFLEQEVNGAGLIKYNEKNKITLHDHNMTALLRYKKLIGGQMVFSQKMIEEVITFRTKSCFFDVAEGAYYDLYDEGLEKGIRIFEQLDADSLTALVKLSGQYLKDTVLDDGRLVYGYFPVFDREIPTYNAIRHCLSVMAFMDIYNLTGDESYKEVIKKSYRYILDTCVIAVDEETAVVVDKDNDNEIRLGALGLTIIMILMYADIFGTNEDLDRAVQIGNAICRLQDERGQFTHVLSYPDLSVKDQFRIVYYSGEACYGLMSLYVRTKDEKYLGIVKKAFDFFIAEKYEKYFDHWLSYAVNELTRYAPEDRYFEFGLKNATNQIDFITQRLTTWPTFLELINAAFTMIERIKELGRDDLLSNYPIDKFYDAVSVRLFRQLNGVLFPEMAMFYQNPERMLYGVFIRHHYFRVRDDDVAHHLIGYCHFIKNVLPYYPDGKICRIRVEG